MDFLLMTYVCALMVLESFEKSEGKTFSLRDIAHLI